MALVAWLTVSNSTKAMSTRPGFCRMSFAPGNLGRGGGWGVHGVKCACVCGYVYIYAFMYVDMRPRNATGLMPL